jgi:shikimate 5-dehydrogenase|tara:strand:- start:7 stop:627 length:621 start_codon:yes stop_codon:yes gene_type:complete
MINKETKIYCSFSSNPGNNGCIFFNSEFKELNMNAIYKSFYSDDIKKSIEAVKILGIKGFALSMPFKIEALDYVDEVEDSARKIGSINTVVNKDGYLKGYNTDWVGVKKYFEIRRFDSIYIMGNGGFSKAVQYTCDVMDIGFEVITRENLNILEELEDKIIFNATPVDVNTDNFLIDGRPHTDAGREIALYQAKEQFKIYTGVKID